MLLQQIIFIGRPALTLVLIAATLFATSSARAQLAECSKCPSPTVTAKSGLGTANAVIEGKLTLQDAKDWCANWEPGSNPDACAQEQVTQDKGAIYRTSANCLTGHLLALNGSSYALAGVWADDIGKGRTKWRDSAGKIVGQDNASNGLGLANQWEYLCPNSKLTAATGGSAAAAKSATASASRSAPPAPQSAVVRSASQARALCGGQPLCSETSSFAAVITDFRTSKSGRYRILSSTVRLQNKLNHPLVLGYVHNSAIAIDDQGNRYADPSDANVRGIGIIGSRDVDTKFILQAGEASDARFELFWEPGRELVGLNFGMDLSVREINPLPGNQLRLGQEHAIHFRGLSNNAATSAARPGSTIPVSAPGPSPVSASAVPEVDMCEGKSRCYGAGPFTAEVVQLTYSPSSGRQRNYLIRMNIKFRNVSNQPLILGYKTGTSSIIDNEGNRFYWGTAGTHDTSATGIGLVEGRNADPQFVLNPGESRSAAFGLFRRPDHNRIGTSYTYDVVISQLELLPGDQIRTVRDYSLNIPDMTASSGSGSVVPTADNLNNSIQKLGSIFKKKP